jgi:DNA repair protein RecN (Recombination protein N)
MLRGLHIRNMLLIDRLDLEFQPGLNVLTGETGAGKSILLDSLGFVLGWRGRADLVRKGADQGEVTAWFDLVPDHPARAVLAEAGFAADDELVLRRTNSPDGRKTAYVNDRRCSGELLRALSETLVELHGQHDDRGLLDPKGHMTLLDDFAGVDLSDMRSKWRRVRRAEADLAAAEQALFEAQKDVEFLRHAVAEMDTLSPEAGEEEALDTQRRLMQSAGRIREDIAKAADAIGPNGADGRITDALRWLDDVSEHAEGRLDEPISSLGRALSELAEAQTGVEDCLAALDFNPLDLEVLEERLFAIRDLARKHNVLPDELSSLATEMRQRLEAVDTGADHLKALAGARDKMRAGYDQLADRISKKRAMAAGKLDRAMAAELAPLKMERAIFATTITAKEAAADGIDQVAFTVATNPGAPAGPINKIASGGELSRFLLALKVCLTAQASGLTLIFDEIDRGVGGATADAVGRRLSALAASAQVLVVTHSPQVAAKGDHQWKVAKSVTKDATTSTVEKLSDADRRDEIARMLAGEVITAEARAAAEALLRS